MMIGHGGKVGKYGQNRRVISASDARGGGKDRGGVGGGAPAPDAAPAAGGAPPAQAELGAVAEATPAATPGASEPAEETPQIDPGSQEKTGGADEFNLHDLFEDKQEVDPRLKNLAESQDNTPAVVLAEELTSLLRDLERMMPEK